MNPLIAVAWQIITFIFEHREELKTMVLGLEDTVGKLMPGSAKAAAVSQMIGKALGVESQVEAAWPIVAPIFNLVVAAIKTPPVPTTAKGA